MGRGVYVGVHRKEIQDHRERRGKRKWKRETEKGEGARRRKIEFQPPQGN